MVTAVKFNEGAIAELALSCALHDVICNMEDLTEMSHEEILEDLGEDDTDIILLDVYEGMDPGNVQECIDEIKDSYTSTIKHVLENSSKYLAA